MALALLIPSVAGAVSADEVRAAIPKVEAFIEELIAADAVPGLSIAIVSGEEVYVKGFGVREVGKPGRVDADTVFQIASLSKPITSTIVSALITDGALTWDTRVSQIDPTFQLFQAYPTAYVTVADLLSHRSGLPGLAGNELEAIGYDRATILHRLRLVQPLNSLRGGYSYSNFGFTAGAVAAARAAGLTWQEAAEQRLFAPLGMTATSTLHNDFLARENRTELHVPYQGRWQPLAKRNPEPQAPAGGVSTNARDIAQWMKLILGNGMFEGRRVVSQEALAQSHTPVAWSGVHPVRGLPSFSGLGWGLSYGPNGWIWTHAGAFSAGARTVATFYPEHGFGVAVLSNAFPTGVPEAVADRLANLIFTGEDGPDTLDAWNSLYASIAETPPAADLYRIPPEAPQPALAPEAYTGTYENAYLGTAVVTASGDGSGLVLALGPDGNRKLPLTHFDRDQFTIVLYPETPDTPSGVSFRIGPEGGATAIQIDELADGGHGTLERVPANR
ncbi:MAG: serine hydrolase [Devosia sp.]